MTQHISIILVSEMHKDPAPNLIVKNTLHALSFLNIPLVYCEEENNVDNLQKIQNELIQNISPVDKYIQKFGLKKFTTCDPSLKRTYVNKENENNIFETVKNILIKYSSEEPVFFADIIKNLIVKSESNKTRLELINAIIDRKINYVPIDDVNMGSNSNYTSEKEEMRIGLMSENILKSTHLLEGKSGIIIAQVGVIHALALANRIKEKVKTPLHEKINFSIQAFYLQSPYVNIESETKTIIEGDAMPKGYFTLKLQDNSSTIETIDIIENADGSFGSVKFDTIIENAKKFTAEKKVFTIPHWDLEKEKLLVNSLNGIVLQLDQNINETSTHAKILIESNKLDKNTRLQLGILRHELTFSADFVLKKKFFESFEDITIEIRGKNKMLLTYPQDKYALVEMAVKNWDLVKIEYKEFISSLRDKMSELSF